MFRALCGDNATKRVVLTTSKWSRMADQSEGHKRENQLKRDFWGGMISQGAKSERFDGTSESALKVVQAVLQGASETVDHVEIQQEIVSMQRLLAETDAGRTLVRTLKETAARLKILDEQMRWRNSKSADPQLRKEYEDNRKRLKETLRQMAELKIPVSRRILSFFGLVVSISPIWKRFN